jgi:hypothetical protein
MWGVVFTACVVFLYGLTNSTIRQAAMIQQDVIRPSVKMQVRMIPTLLYPKLQPAKSNGKTSARS